MYVKDENDKAWMACKRRPHRVVCAIIVQSAFLSLVFDVQLLAVSVTLFFLTLSLHLPLL